MNKKIISKIEEEISKIKGSIITGLQLLNKDYKFYKGIVDGRMDKYIYLAKKAGGDDESLHLSNLKNLLKPMIIQYSNNALVSMYIRETVRKLEDETKDIDSSKIQKKENKYDIEDWL